MTCHAARGRARGAPQAQGRVGRRARATPSTARVGVRPSQARARGRRRRPRPCPAARGRDATGARRRPNPEKSDRFRAEPRRSPAAFVDHRAWPRTFTGAAIIAEDMVREKAMMDVACGRRRRTARESVARPTARAPLKVFPARKAEFRIYGDFLGSQTVGSIDKTTSHRTSTSATATVALGAPGTTKTQVRHAQVSFPTHFTRRTPSVQCPPSPLTPPSSRARLSPARRSPRSAPPSRPRRRSTSPPAPRLTRATRTPSLCPPPSSPPTSPPSARRYAPRPPRDRDRESPRLSVPTARARGAIGARSHRHPTAVRGRGRAPPGPVRSIDRIKPTRKTPLRLRRTKRAAGRATKKRLGPSAARVGSPF